jgi:signal transduction histidine kinase
MAILIGVPEAVALLGAVALVTAAILRWHWHRRLKAELSRAEDEHQRELANIRSAYDEKQLTDLRDIVREFRHQANQYLRPINDNLYILQGEAESSTASGAVGEAVANVARYEWRLNRLIENIAMVTTLENPGATYTFSEVILDVVASDVVELFGLKARDKETELSWWSKPHPFPRITANQAGLREALINLVHNSTKYCGKGDRIEVSLEAIQAKNVVYMRVSDTGAGIPEEDLERVFLKGYTVEKARGRPPVEGGLGLGLYIVKLIVERHRGHVELTSELGKGTTVTVTLPIHRV